MLKIIFKPNIALFLFICLLTRMGISQTRMVIDIGGNLSNLNRNLLPEGSVTEYKPIFGFQAGIRLQRQYHKKNYLSFGIEYSDRGGKDLAHDFPLIEGPFINRSNFIQFPLVYERACLFRDFKLGVGLINSYELFRQTRIIGDENSERNYGIDIQLLTSYSFTPNLGLNIKFLYGSLLDHLTSTADLTHSVLSCSMSYNFKINKK